MTKPLARFGTHGLSVRVYVEGDRVFALWRQDGQRKKKSWPDTRANRLEAKAWGETFALARTRAAKPRELIRTDELWRRYMAAEFPLLRPKTQRLYTDYWRRWQVFVAPERVAEDLGAGTMTEFRTHLDRTLGPTTVHRCLSVIKTVYAWGFANEHLAQNRVRDHKYKVAKDKRPALLPEFRGDEIGRILEHLPLTKATTWRAGAALAVCAYQGSRVNAVLHLDWRDVDTEAMTIHWRPEWDKQGRDQTQPMREPTRAALEAIRHYTKGEGFVFAPGNKLNKRGVYSVQSLLKALHGAELAAGLATVKGKGAHSLRRMLFNDVLSLTGDLATAMGAIRDTSLQVASKYLRERGDQVRKAFDRLDTNDPGTAQGIVSRGTTDA